VRCFRRLSPALVCKPMHGCVSQAGLSGDAVLCVARPGWHCAAGSFAAATRRRRHETRSTLIAHSLPLAVPAHLCVVSRGVQCGTVMATSHRCWCRCCCTRLRWQCW
jgi:hypothetical protein